MVVKGFGKINLGLDVLRRLPNGYHEVKMVMQSVDLYDELTFEMLEDTSVVLTSNIEGLEVDERNLIVKAARLLMKHTGKQFGVRIHLEKHIPMAAGMAGGSADAAATLVGLNELFQLGLTIDTLKELGVTIGADIPFCIEGGTQLSEGIGEKLTILSDYVADYILIAKPDIDVSTKYVYENLHVDTLEKHPNIDGIVQAIQDKDSQGVYENMDNVLQRVTEVKYTVIADLKKMMLDAGACNSMMSGSGPTVFGIFDSKEKLERAYELVRESGLAKTVEKTKTKDCGVQIL